MKLNNTSLEKIEQIYKDLSYTVRYEKGNFNSGYCIVEDKKIVVLNKFFNAEGRANILLDILSMIDVSEEMLSDKSKTFFSQILKSQEYQLKASPSH